MSRHVLFAVAATVAILLSAELSLSLPLAGIGPDLLILVVVAFGIGERPRTAATAGFIAGLMKDLLLVTPKGLSAFAYAVTAYGAALAGIPRGVGQAVGLLAASTFASQLLFGLGAIFLGPQVDPAPLPRMLFITTAYNALISPLLMPLLNRVVRADSGAQALD